MNSKERHLGRYLRRKAKRDKKKAELHAQYDDFDVVFTYSNLRKSRRKCYKGVGWKRGTQKVRNKPITTTSRLYRKIHSGTYKSRGFYCFVKVERGKPRSIKSVDFPERIVQTCLCVYAIVPMFTRVLVYDNGACIKGKGIDFQKKRLVRHLQKYFRTTGGNEGYAWVIDFHSYFDLILHSIVCEITERYFTDERIIKLFMYFIGMFGDGVSLGLGSRVSQITAVIYPNEIDHYIKEVLHIRFSARYMDDSYLIHESKEYLTACMVEVARLCEKYGIEFNTKKTQIVKISNGIKFLKQRFVLTETSKVLMIPTHESEKRMRSKLKVFSRWIESGKMTMEEATASYCSWKSHLKLSNAHYRLRRMDKRFYKLIKSKGELSNGSN